MMMQKAADRHYSVSGTSTTMVMFQHGMPLLFVLIWATGFIVERLVAPHAEPLTFLTLRYLLSVAVFSVIAYAVGPSWPHTGRDFGGSWEAWVGLLWAVFGLSVGAISLLLVLIKRGAVAGVASLFYLVPPVAAFIAFFLFGEHLNSVQMIGMALAASGVALANPPTPR